MASLTAAWAVQGVQSQPGLYRWRWSPRKLGDREEREQMLTQVVGLQSPGRAGAATLGLGLSLFISVTNLATCCPNLLSVS